MLLCSEVANISESIHQLFVRKYRLHTVKQYERQSQYLFKYITQQFTKNIDTLLQVQLCAFA